MIREDDGYKLSTGKTFYANCGILGVGESLREVRTISISEGYDGGIEAEDFTPEERKEIADYAIKLWGEWAGAK